MADAAWKQFLSFEEKHNNDDACDHQQCLDALKAAMREALRMSLHPKKSPTNTDDARSSLLLIERTLKGQTCSFGNYIFNFRQGCIVLLNLLKLLPEPSFESVAQELASMAAQLVEQLGRQDFSLLRSFISDSVSALTNARERPFTTMAFPKFVQRCKVAVSEETPGSTTKAGSAGLPLELSTSLRMSTFCSRLLKLTIIIVRSLAPFTSLVDLELLWGVAQGLASDVVTWSEQATFDTADSVRMVVAFLDTFRALLLDGLAPECLRVMSLHVQAGVLDEFPRIAAFAMRECDDDARQALVDLAAKLVTTFDETLLFPCLPEVLSPFWPCESRPSSCLHVFLAAGARFGGINVPGEELWRRFAIGQVPVTVASSAGGGGALAALEPKSHALLAAALQRLRAHVPICSYAVSCVKEPRATGLEPLQQTVLLALAVRTLPPSEIKTVGQVPSCNAALARFTHDASTLMRKQLPVQPGVHSEALRIVLETLLEHPWCTNKLENDGETFLAGLMQAVSAGKAPAFAWELVLLALQVFVVRSQYTLQVKFRCLQKLVTRSPKQPTCVLAAGWVALGNMLLFYLKRRKTPPEASAKAQGDSETLVYNQVLQLLAQHLGSGHLLHQSVLAAMAYLFPLLTAFSYMLPDLSDSGEVLRMPYIPEVFMESKQSYADTLRSLNSPCRSVPNPLRTRPAFDQFVLASDEIGSGSSTKTDRISSTVVLPALCPFCDTQPPKSSRLDSDHCQTELQQTRTCPKCGMELLTLEWTEAFVQGGSKQAFAMPLAWGRLRHPDVDTSSKDTRWSQANTCCWVKTTAQLMGVFSRLCRSLIQAEENATAKWAGLLEPGESQDLAANAAASGTDSRSGSQEVMWLLRCGLLGLCVSAPSEQLHAQKAPIIENLRRLLPKPKQIASTWERNSIPNVLLSLVQSNSFVSALLQLGNPHDLGWHKKSASFEVQQDRLGAAQRSAQWKCNHWRLELFGVATCSPWKELLERPRSLLGLPDGASPSADQVAVQPGLLPPRLFSATFAGAPRAAMASALALLISAVAAPRSKTQNADGVAASLCLQQLFAIAMLVRHSFEDLFASLQGDMYLRLFERYSKSTHRACSLCQLVLRGPLDAQVRALLPKILPAMVLAKKMQTIQDLCALLEESVQSLFTPQLPYILSAIAQQPVQHVAGSFMFILQRVYHNQMTIANICDASLGQVLVLILWNSAGVGDNTEARSQAFSAVDKIVSALKTHQSNGAASVGGKRPGGAPAPGGSVATTGGPATRKRRLGDKGVDAAVVEVASDGPSPEVVQTLEGSFLHVLDILEIVLTGNRQSPKWTEYSSLLDAQCDGDAVDQGRLLAAIALLFELVPESLHRFAPKVLEFLQSATAGSEYLDESIRCWRQFVNFVGVQRLKPLIPAVVGELLHIAGQLKRQNPVNCQQFCDSFFCGVIDSSCKQHPDIVVLLPALPPWSELRAARTALEKAVGPQKQNTFVERLKAGLRQLESTTQQAVRRAALDHIRDLVAGQRSVSPAGVSELNTTLLAELMRSLFKFLWESSAWPDDQLKCGQLLGAIGAVDPSRFSRVDLGEAKARTPQDLGSSELLAKRMLAEFLVPNLTSKNAYAFAVQEILKYLQSRGKADKILKDLREDVRETLRPYLSSSYQLIEGGAQLMSDTSSFEGVVAQAASLVQGDQRALFEACLPAVHGNHALALFLMHHVLHHLLTSNTSLGDLGKLSMALAGLLESPKHATAQAVFTLVDDMIQRQEQLQSEVPVASKPGDATARNRQLQRIEQMRRPITNRKVVAASVRCHAHARALQFLEEAMIEEAQSRNINPFDTPRIQSEDDCFLLQSIYNNLDEPDGVLGALRVGPATVRMRTLQSKQAGRWQDVQACYEEQLSLQAASGGQSSKAFERQELLSGLVQCEQNMRRFESSLRLIQGMDGEDMQASLRPHAVEAAWQLSSWDRLQQALDMPSAHDAAGEFQVQLGQALLAFHEQESGAMQSVLKETTLQVTRTLASAARESYARAYQHLLKLHVLSDISWLAESREVFVGKSKSREAELGATAPSQVILGRLEATAPTFHTRQLILSTTRVALTDMALTDDAKQIELAFVRLCRKQNVPISMEHPSISFAQVSPDLASRAQLEWGRLLYARGSRHDALQHMQQLALSHPKARLLGTRWATEASSELLIPKVAEAEFKEAKEKLPEYEASWFYHASYLDQLLKEQITSKKDHPAGKAPRDDRGLQRNHSASSGCPFDLLNLVTFTLRGYLQALHRGNKRLHFILNRVLQLVWECCELNIHKKEALAEVDRQAQAMQPWMWYVVLPQLISRVHNPDMRQVFMKLIMKALVAFPHQAGWQMVQLLKSSDKEHQKLGKDMLLEVGRSRNDVHRTMVMYYHVCDDLNTLATFNPPHNDTTMTLDKTFPKLVGSFSKPSDAWRVLVPLQSQMTAVFPMTRIRQDRGVFNPFPEMICTERCLEQVEVFRTKERPKKVTFRGNDGKTYTFLCKAERRGDLRKDSRMMQFGAMVNQLLQRNPDARRRNLEVQTFNVVIFAERCGLIEWVSNTKGVRHIIDDLWRRVRPGTQQSLREIKELFDRSKDLYETFTKQVLPRHPPMLHRWFSQKADPSVWFSRRLLYSRSQALWCMLGYILGLGDRHGENILLDTESGRVVHVDFDCLFGKGMLLERPETVPFRLTQNCVSALGITGIEGGFRKSCELCMEVLRDRANQQTLLSVLHVFIADPLIEWTSTQQKAKPQEGEEPRGIQQARTTIGDVERKLNGMLNVGAVVRLRVSDTESVLSREERGKGLLGRDRGVGLSVAGQVDELLKAAMCKHNLSEMYVGWQPWL